MTELGKRVATASVLIPIVVAAVFALPTPALAVVLGLLAALGAWEWAALAGVRRPAARALYAGLVFAMTLLLRDPLRVDAVRWTLILAGCAWWCVALSWVVTCQQGREVAALRAPAVRLLAGWLVLLPAWAALVELHASRPSGPALLVFLLVLVWGADIGAFFAGRRWGRTRLASRVSPGKSWEGVAGGLAVVAALAVAFAVVAGMVYPLVVGFTLLCLVTVMVSILGDLAESMFKRHAGVKDSGTILPGHGGVLDRIDSLLAAAPLFLTGLVMVRGPG